MNNYFIIGKVNEGKSYLFNLFSKTHKTISNPKANTTIDVIRKNILSKSDFKISIPQKYVNGIDSYNAANSLAIAAYHFKISTF